MAKEENRGSGPREEGSLLDKVEQAAEQLVPRLDAVIEASRDVQHAIEGLEFPDLDPVVAALKDLHKELAETRSSLEKLDVKATLAEVKASIDQLKGAIAAAAEKLDMSPVAEAINRFRESWVKREFRTR